MYINKYKILIAVLLILISSTSGFAQKDPEIEVRSKRDKSFRLYIGGGISYYTATINQPTGQKINVTRTSPATTIRVMWFPQYRLRIGLESGKTTFYSYDLKNGNNYGKLRLTAVPVLVTWSMPVLKRLNIYAGFGSYFLTTHLDYLGKVNSKSVSLGSNFALAYQQPVSKKLQLAAEVKWMNAFVTKNAAVSAQLQLAWKFWEWSSL
ncbi:MAG: hypothetical protein ABIQ31_18005 [Ferruginibacter sp.]